MRSVFRHLKTSVFIFLMFVFSTQAVAAVTNNKQNVPEIPVLRDLRAVNPSVDNATSNGPGPWCDPPTNKYKQGQVSWLSPEGTNESTAITIGQGTNSVPLWYNVIGFGCDVIFNAAGDYNDTNLRESKVNVEQATASIVGRSTSVSVSGLNSDTEVFLDYNPAYFYKNRFVKGPNDRPHFKPFSVSGLSSLPAGNYVVRVVVRDYMVNRFASGAYRCVYGDKAVDDYDDPGYDVGCIYQDRPLTINLTVISKYDGTCEFLNIPTSVSVGAAFGVQFRVNNTGSRVWDRRFVKLATVGDVSTWGRARTTFPNGTGTIAAGTGTQTFTTSANYFTAPSTPGVYTFPWRIIQENSNPPAASPNPFPGTVDNIGRCSTTITVYENRSYPYLRGTTNDIWTGAAFSPDRTGQCSAYAPSVLTAAATAKAQANTLNSLSTLNGNKPKFERAAVYVARMYKAILGPNRAYEVSGGKYWIDEYVSGKNEAELINSFLSTAEAQNRMGSANNTQYVQLLYQGLFERPAATGEAQGWVNLMTNNGWSRGRVARAIIYSIDNGPFGIGDNYNYGGSGSDYGVFSTGTNQVNHNNIGGLVGGNGLRSSGQTEVFDLTFANTDVSVDSNHGGFSQNGLCLENYFLTYEDKPKETISAATPAEANTILMDRLANVDTSAVYRRAGSGTATIGAVTLREGADVVLLVNGNVTINGNITYANTYGTTSQPRAPRFVLIARGTVTITQAVTQLDGIYIAQPKTENCTAGGATCTNVAGTGIIQTCSDSEHTTPSYRVAGSQCGTSQLKVNGSLIAHRLRLYRRYGSIGVTFDDERGNLASLQCAALKNFWATNPDSFAALYSTKTPGTVNDCAGEWVDAHPERYFSSGVTPPAATPQSYKELPPIY